MFTFNIPVMVVVPVIFVAPFIFVVPFLNTSKALLLELLLPFPIENKRSVAANSQLELCEE